jgi:hypothetical protein
MPNNIARPDADLYEPRFPLQSKVVTSVPWDQAQVAYDQHFRLSGGHAGANVQTMERIAKSGGWGLAQFACLYQGHTPKGHNPHMFDCIAQTFLSIGQETKPEPEEEDGDNADQTN